MELPPGSGLPMMKIVAFAGWPSMAAAQTVSSKTVFLYTFFLQSNVILKSSKLDKLY